MRKSLCLRCQQWQRCHITPQRVSHHFSSRSLMLIHLNWLHFPDLNIWKKTFLRSFSMAVPLQDSQFPTSTYISLPLLSQNILRAKIFLLKKRFIEPMPAGMNQVIGHEVWTTSSRVNLELMALYTLCFEEERGTFLKEFSLATDSGGGCRRR